MKGIKIYNKMLINILLLNSFLVLATKVDTKETYHQNPKNEQKRKLDFDPAKMYMLNWTTCDEFLNNSNFDIDKILHIDWKIFYYWNHDLEEAYVVRFSKPSKLLTDRFEAEVGKDVDPPVNWTAAVAFMETGIEFSALYIGTHRNGLYRLLPSFSAQLDKVPLLHFALKYVEPEGYLGIMNCRQRMAYALAPVRKMPKDAKSMEAAAKKIGFVSDWGQSIIRIPEGYTHPPDHEYQELVTDDSDLIGYDEDPNAITLF